MKRSGSGDSRSYHQTLVRVLMRAYALLGFITGITLTGVGIAVSLRLLAGVAAVAYLYVVWHYGGSLGGRSWSRSRSPLEEAGARAPSQRARLRSCA
jgi:hypothetical protein